MTRSDFLAGRTVVVTGAGDELGRSHICALARAGARVYASDAAAGWGEDGRRLLRDILGPDERAVVLAEHECETAPGAAALWDAAVRQFGEVHGLVNAAGRTRDRTLTKMSDEEWDDVFASCLDGVFYTTRAAARYWRDLRQKGGGIKSCVVNRSSTSAMPGQPGQANYAAAMSGAATFSVVAAREGARFAMRVNCICGPFDAAALRDVAERGKAEQSRQEGWRLSPAILSPAVVALLGADCDITGQILFVGRKQVRTLQPWAILSEVPVRDGVGAAEMAGHLAQLTLRMDDW